jgi:hypothetical protein
MAVRGSVRGVLASLVLGFSALVACGGGSSTYAAAGIGLGATVLATGIHRAVTGSCWANCAKGFYCDHESGMCQRGECDPSCREGDYCVKEASGDFRCVAPAGTYAFDKSKRAPSESDAGSDAGSPASPLLMDAGVSAESDASDAGVIALSDAGAETTPGSDDAGAAATEP